MKRNTLLPKGAQAARSASSHDRMLLAAKRLFATRGYENTSTVAIARMAGTSESQMMKHFGSKEGLLEAIFDRAWMEMEPGIRQAMDSPSPTGKLGTLGGLMMRKLEKDWDLRSLMLLEGRRIRKEGQMVLLTRGFLNFVRTIDATLREMRDSREFRSDVNVQAFRSALMGAMEGLMRDQILARQIGFPARFGAKDVRRMFADLVAAFARKR